MNKFTSTISQIFKSLIKHKFLLILSLLCCIFGILQIYEINENFFWGKDYNNRNYYIFSYLSSAFLMSAFFTIPAVLLSEKMNRLKKCLIQGAASLIGFGIGFSVLYFEKRSSYSTMYYAGILLSEIAFTLFLFIPKKSSESYFSTVFKHFLFSGIISLIGFIGSLLIFWAIDSLLYSFEDFFRIVESSFLFFGSVVYFNLFVFYFFERREEDSGKGFKIVILYVLFPIYVLLLAVLYIYLFKSLFLFSLPNGQINWFVSYATTFYIVFYFILKEYKETKIAGLFYKVGAFVILPLVCVQLPSFFIRINAYGFTGWRFSSLLYIIFSIITIVSTFIKKGKFTKFAIPLLSIFILFASITPLNLIDVAYNSQYKILEKVLYKYKMFDGNKLTDYDKNEINHTIEPEDRKSLYGSYRYIRYTSEHEKPVWFGKYLSFSEFFGISSSDEPDFYSYYFSINKNDLKKMKIEGFKTIQFESVMAYRNYGQDNPELYNSIKLKKPDLDITDFILSLPENLADYIYYELDENTTLVFSDIHYSCKDRNLKSFYSYSIEYAILEK